MSELAPMKRRLTWTVYATPLMTPTTDLGLSIRVFMFEYVRLVTATSSTYVQSLILRKKRVGDVRFQMKLGKQGKKRIGDR